MIAIAIVGTFNEEKAISRRRISLFCISELQGCPAAADLVLAGAELRGVIVGVRDPDDELRGVGVGRALAPAVVRHLHGEVVHLAPLAVKPAPTNHSSVLPPGGL